MMKTSILCSLAAIGGALVAFGWIESRRQEQQVAGPPASANPLRAPVASRPPIVAQFESHSLAQADTETVYSADEKASISVYENVNRSVVNIHTRAVRTDRFSMLQESSVGSGSGSVLDKKGHILTNFHVIEDARRVNVTLYDGETYDASLVGLDPASDMAVIKIEAPEASLHPVPFGDSRGLRVGQYAFAIGNPFGLERTLTRGIISSLNRSISSRNSRTIKSIIQTDAAINPGNSGGPLLDNQGRLIGMNTAIASRTGQSSGVGFAIPVSTISRVVPQLISTGRVVRADAGISRVYETDQGLRIIRLSPGGPAESAGLRGPSVERRRRGPLVWEYVDVNAADVIVAVDGQPVKTAEEFLTQIESHQPGEEVQLTVVRKGQETRVSLVLVEDEP